MGHFVWQLFGVLWGWDIAPAPHSLHPPAPGALLLPLPTLERPLPPPGCGKGPSVPGQPGL